MLEVFLPLYDVLALKAFSGAECMSVDPQAEVHSAAVVDGALVLLDADGSVVAEVVNRPEQTRLGPDAGYVAIGNDQPLLGAYDEVTSELTSRTRFVADRSHAILHALTEADLQGRTVQEVVTLLAQFVDNPVILKDPSHRVLAWSGEAANLDAARQDTVSKGVVTDEVLEALDSRGILARIRDARAPFRIEADPRVGLAPRMVCPVVAGDTHLGYLSISEGSRKLDALDVLAVESGATVLAFHLSRERAVEESIRSQRALLLYELLFLPEGRTPRMRRRQAVLLGIDLEQTFMAVSIQFEHGESVEEDPERWSRRLTSMVATVDATLHRLGVTSTIAMAEDDGLLVIMPTGEGDVAKVVDAVLSDLAAHHRVPTVCTGVSLARTGSAGLSECYEEARLAAKLGRSLHGAGSVTHYEDLGALRLLNEVGDSLLERHLTATLTDDEDFREQFFETFGALVEAGYNKAAAARTLYIHVNTLKYRLNRIRNVTGQDPADHHGRFALECTFRLLQLQRAREAHG